MSGADRRADGSGPRETGVRDELRESPFSFRFFQAVRLLQREGGGNPVGRFGDPADEVVRFGVNPRLAFPASQIETLEDGDRADGPLRMRVNFMGLVGHLGVLPHHYSMTVMERVRARDHALQDFLDLFHHRLLSLFYRAWERYRFYAAYERGEVDPVTDHLDDLLGMEVDPASDGGLARAVLTSYLGLLGPRQRSAAALEQVVADYFGVAVEVEQFVGGWFSMSEAQCRVDDESTEASGILGYGALVGDEVWDPHARARIVLGPLERKVYDRFLPDGDAFGELRDIVRHFADEQVEFELKLVLRPDDVRPIVLGDDDTTPLGWGTWLRSTDGSIDAAETLLTL